MAPTSPSSIPLAYRVIFTYIEPLLATLGAIQALVGPAKLLAYSLPSVAYTASLGPLFPQMAGAWLQLAFHDGVTLRASSSALPEAHKRWLWRHVLAAALLSDVGYTAGLVQSMGARRFADPTRWGDLPTAFTVVTTVLPMLAKVLFLLGVGLPREEAGAEGEEAKKDL
ncbi:hypothetical protein F4780DRAFT_223788 [Xylariomycetidae sp. FL0641]|nr:hypothetical protein F4780DRAFT_223788 [Xylariomycetidae sp. FL0641]